MTSHRRAPYKTETLVKISKISPQRLKPKANQRQRHRSSSSSTRSFGARATWPPEATALRGPTQLRLFHPHARARTRGNILQLVPPPTQVGVMKVTQRSRILCHKKKKQYCSFIFQWKKLELDSFPEVLYVLGYRNVFLMRVSAPLSPVQPFPKQDFLFLKNGFQDQIGIQTRPEACQEKVCYT